MLAAQPLINLDEAYTFGSPVPGVGWSDGLIDTGTEYGYHTGNTLVNGRPHLLLGCQDPDGQPLWSLTWARDSLAETYGVAVARDAGDYLYVAAASRYGHDSTLDVVLLKVNIEDQQVAWSVAYDGPDSLADLALDLGVNAAGTEIYLTGLSQSVTGGRDVLTLKYNGSGSLKWARLEDRNGFDDLGVKLLLDAEGDGVYVTGASGKNSSDWDFLALQYNATGVLQGELEVTGAGLGFDQPTALVRDGLGNLYVSGAAASGSGDYDMQTVKLDSSLNLQWKRTWGGSEDDRGLDLALDPAGYLYVAGSRGLAGGGEEFTLLQYDVSNGDVNWQHALPGEAGGSSVAKAVTVDQRQRAVVSGEVYGSGGQGAIRTLAFEANGELAWQHHYPHQPVSGDAPMQIHAPALDEIRLGGITTTGAGVKYLQLGFGLWERPQAMLTGSNGLATMRKRDLVVRFNPDLVSPSFVDQPQRHFAVLSEVLPDSVITAMNQAASSGIDFGSVKVEKLHKRMTRADSLSVTRLGDTIRVPAFWSRLAVVLDKDGYDLEAVADSLETLTDYIWYAEPNYAAHLTDIPNDPRWDDQFSLNNDPQFVDATINADPAWDVENGNDGVRVGVYDTGLDWRHEDFSLDGTNTFGGSKIAGGWDYVNEVALSVSINPDNNGHGTSCAGIIGALRNNNLGIAGIAGGDITVNNAGCQLFGMKIAEDVIINGQRVTDFVASGDIAAAIEEGAVFNPNTNFGFGLHIMNHSWGGPSNSQAVEEAVRFTFENQVTFVVARGNWLDVNNPNLLNHPDVVAGNAAIPAPQTPNNNDLTYPACYRDEFVINVGGTGVDGQWKSDEVWPGPLGNETGNGNWNENQIALNNNPPPPFIEVLDDQFVAMIGNGVDVAAPATRALVWATGQTNQGNDPDAYRRFNGTSAAAPHVAGVAALMMSEQNNRGQFTPLSLAPDDIEFLVQRYAEDRGAPGIDDETGAGLLNAEAVMQNLEFPDFQVFHSGAPDSRQQTTVGNNFLAWIPSGVFDLPAGHYVVNRVQITDSYLQVFPFTATVLDTWPLLSAVRGVSAANPLNDDNWQDIIINVQGNAVSATAITNAFFIRSNASTNINRWVPAPPADLRTGFAVHIHNPSITSQEALEANQELLELYPNPTAGQLTLAYQGKASGPAQLSVIDLAGREVKSLTLGYWASGDQVHTIDLAELPAGIYMLRLAVGNESYQQRFIKQ